MSERSVSLRDAGRGPAGTEESAGRDSHVRKPFPVDRAAHWIPKRSESPAAPAPDGPYEIVVRRESLAEMSRHVSGDKRESRFGFLLGRLHRCPVSGLHYAVVDTVLPAAEEFAEDAPGAYLLRAWADAQPEFRRHPGVLLGWYHSHHLLGLLLSEGDEDANRRYFSEPWQSCVLFVPDDARPLGCLFRPGISRAAGGALNPEPFWELPDENGKGGRPSLDWTNYELRKAEPIAGLPAPAEVARSGREDQVSVAGPGHPRPPAGDEAGEIPGSIVIPSETDELRPFAPRGRRISWTTLFALVAILALIGTVIAVGMRTEPTPQVTRPMTERPTRSVIPPEITRFGEIAAELQRSIDRYGERANDFDLGRIGCDLLTTGYGSVDESFIRLVAMRSQIAPSPGSELMLQFDQLSQEVDDVNRHFDASGCPRPE
ncbi:MAG: hypothetical protein M8863_04040 [marine benthic group bacterium]|nr:hypothetical protein [Gemmatimonadota bacterium]